MLLSRLAPVIAVLLAGSVPVHSRCYFEPDKNGHVDWPADQRKIPKKAFRNCKRLKTINIPPEVYFVHDSAFLWSALNLLEVAASALQRVTELEARVAELEGRCGEAVPSMSPTDACISTALVKLPRPAGRGGTIYESIVVSGDTLVVGSPDENGPGGWMSGAAYVYSRKTSGAWKKKQRLVASDGAPWGHFSLDIAFDGDTLVIGAGANDNDENAVYVFTLQAGLWKEDQKLTTTDETKNFGQHVAVHGDTLVVGDWSNGSAYVFSLRSGTWVQTTKLKDPDEDVNSSFGVSLAVSPGLIVVGAQTSRNFTKARVGAVYVYTPDTFGSWTQAQKLLASDTGTSGNFGRSVAASDDGTVVVGETCSDCPGVVGSVYVFSCTAAGVCTETDVLRATDGAAWDHFGKSVAVSRNTIVVGASGDDDDNKGQGWWKRGLSTPLPANQKEDG